ncbi:MAG: cyclic peptide export ABC transporter [Acidobacteriota bacterium]
MKLLYFLLRSSKLFPFSVIAGIICGISNTFLLMLINRLMNNANFSLKTAIVGFIALCITILVARVISQSLIIQLGQRSVYQLRLMLARQIAATPLRKLEELGVERLLSTLTEDVVTVTMAVIYVPIVCVDAVIIICCLFYLAWLSPTVIAVTLFFLVSGGAAYFFFSNRTRIFLKLAREDQNQLFKQIRLLIDGNKELKLNQWREQEFFDKLFIPAAESYRRHYVSGMNRYTVLNAAADLLFFVLIGLLIFLLPWLTTVGASVLASAIITVIYLLGPINTVFSLLPYMGRAQTALEHAESLGLDLVSVPAQSTYLPHLPLRLESLELRDITHSYYVEKEDRNFVLGPINLVFNPGEVVYLIGGNGSGKTTLAKLIAGLYMPEKGSIWLNGECVNAETLAFYRQHFSVIFSDYCLFDDLLGVEQHLLTERAGRYLAELQLDHKVEIKNGGFSTTALSQGQRKRLALLVAYLEDRPIYLFDEWASDQDPAFKDVFYTKIIPELKEQGKMVLAITHDDKYFHHADRIIKMDYGKVSDLPMRLPIQVSSAGGNIQPFVEQTETVQISKTSVVMLLSRKVNIDNIFLVSLPMPKELRLFDYDESFYRVYVQVREVKRQPSGGFLVRTSLISKDNPLISSSQLTR